MSMDSAAMYELPFRYVEEHVRPERSKNKRESYREKWWLHVEPRSGYRRAANELTSPRTSVVTVPER
jgi:hypothetical protein